MSRHSHSNSHNNRYSTLADKAEVEDISLHTISDDENSLSTVQATADEEELQLKNDYNSVSAVQATADKEELQLEK